MGPDGAGDADKVALGQQILLETLLRRGQDKLCAKVTYLMSREDDHHGFVHNRDIKKHDEQRGELKKL